MHIRRIVLCTGPVDSMSARYAVHRLAVGFPDASITVFHQSGAPGKADVDRSPTDSNAAPHRAPSDRDDDVSGTTARVPAGGSLEPFAVKKRYWMLRARLFQSEAAGWRRRYFVRDARRTDRLLKREMRRSSAATLPTTTHRVATVNDHAESIRALQPDVLLIYGGGIVSARILQAARVALNVHAGKLPEYRGVHSALFALAQGRPDHVGVTVHVAEASLDSGPIAAWRPFPVDRVSSMPELRCHLCREGMSAAIEVIREIGESGVDPDAQTGGARPRRAKDITAETIRGAYRAIRSTRCGPEQASSARPVTVWTG